MKIPPPRPRVRRSLRIGVATALTLTAAAVVAPSAEAAVNGLVPGLSVNCSPGQLLETNTTTCTVTGQPSPLYTNDTASPVVTPSGVVTFSGNGSFTPASCTLSTVNNVSQCSVTYAPAGAGSDTRVDTVTAGYAGDQYFQAASTFTTVGVRARQQPVVAVTCTPNRVYESNTTACIFTAQTAQLIQGDTTPIGGTFTPTGTVTFSGAGGGFSPASCTLTAANNVAQCTVSYTPSGPGSANRTDSISAAYSGDHVFAPTTASTTVSVVPRENPVIAVTCSPNRVITGRTTTCTFTGQPGSLWPNTTGPSTYYPTGTVTFSSPSGVFTPASCSPTRVNNVTQCAVSYTPTGPAPLGRSDRIDVAYSGDQIFAPASAYTTITVTSGVLV
ncbi:MAG: hypothetical protein ACTHMS_06140 [Jatrophihabitans sp.]|uniref:hypothetical protein n=1 Tax=Jatrophihabitans sp. TaxID=1932789 RepID=UPI003F813BE3